MLALVLCAVTAGFAWRKGYNAVVWFFAASLIGLVVLSFLPFVESEGERLAPGLVAKRRKTGNVVGGALAAFSVLVGVAILTIK